VPHVVSELAADPAVGAHGWDFPVGFEQADSARRHKRAGRTRLHTFSAGNTGALTHRIVEIENDLGMLAPESVADHVIHLLFAAGPHTPGTLNARVQVDR